LDFGGTDHPKHLVWRHSASGGGIRVLCGGGRGGLGFGTMSLELWLPAGTWNNCGVFCQCMVRSMPSSVRAGGSRAGDFGEQCCLEATANLPTTRNSPCKHPRAGADLKPCAPDHTHQSVGGFWRAWVHRWRLSRWCARPGVRTGNGGHMWGAGDVLTSNRANQFLAVREITPRARTHYVGERL